MYSLLIRCFHDFEKGSSHLVSLQTKFRGHHGTKCERIAASTLLFQDTDAADADSNIEMDVGDGSSDTSSAKSDAVAEWKKIIRKGKGCKARRAVATLRLKPRVKRRILEASRAKAREDKPSQPTPLIPDLDGAVLHLGGAELPPAPSVAAAHAAPSGLSSSSGVAVPPAVPPAVPDADDGDGPPRGGGGGGDPDPGGPDRGPRVARQERWGPFLLAEIWSRGVHVGFGATCGRHLNAGSQAVCKKQLRFCELSPEETKRLVKGWCLIGDEIPRDDVRGKSRHIDVDRRAIQLLSDAELDRRLGRIAWG